MDATSRQRSMTFTGCWTCKRRKVKCDERPITCENCMRMGITCEGYSIRLQWITDPTISKAPSISTARSGRIRIETFRGPYYGTEEIEEFLGLLENDSESQTFSQRGPFTLFPISNDALHVSTPSPPSVESLDQANIHSSLGHRDRSPTADDDDVQLVTGDDAGEDYQQRHLYLFDKTSSPQCVETASKRPQQKDSRRIGYSVQSIGGISSASDSMATTENDDEEHAGHYYMALATTSTMPSLNVQTQISGNSIVELLMHHYITNLADLLQPIRHQQNPYRNLYAPAALECASYTTVPRAAVATKINWVMYHSLLAASAFHLWQHNLERSKYHRIGSQHRQQALYHLQSAIATGAPPTEYRALLMAMLSLVTIDVMSGAEADFAVHLEAATQLRRSRRHWKVISTATQQLNEISAFLSLLARTLSFKVSPTPWLQDEQNDEDEGSSNLGPGNCFEYMYGITPSIAHAIEETCRLSEYLSYYEYKGTTPPESLREACERLGEQLLSWSFEHEKSTSIPAVEVEMLAILQHHANAWHKAALIYYYRRIQKYRSYDMTAEVDSVAIHMHLIEDIKAGLESDRARTRAPITWPAFIASCDATNRDTWQEWWERVQSYGIANIHRQWDIVQQIWEAVDQIRARSETSQDWIWVYKKLEIALLPI